MNITILSEVKDNELSPATLSTITAAKQLGAQLKLVIISLKPFTLKRSIDGVDEVVTFTNLTESSLCASNLSQIILSEMSEQDVLMAASNTFSRDVLPRVAAKLDVAMLSDVIEIIDENTFKRPTYAGNAIETIKSLDSIKVITIRSTAFEKAMFNDAHAALKEKEANFTSTNVEFIGLNKTSSERPELNNASIVVSGGRGVKSKDNFKLIEDLADSLNAAVGASRAAVDAGFVSNDLQVGQTGKVVAPSLYISVGISGAIQHLAGMKDSKVIVSINKDPEAPINQIATYRLVADLFDVLPELTKKLKALQGEQ